MMSSAKICDQHAARGRFALAPDLFWRLEPGVQLTDKTQEDWGKAFGLMQRFDVDQGVERHTSLAALAARGQAAVPARPARSAIASVDSSPSSSATRTDADASVGYYGVNLQNRLNEAAKIRKPLMLHIAAKDQFCPPEAQKQIIDGLKGNALVTIHVYPEMDHAFAREGGQHYDKACADLANSRTDAFFRQYLG